MGQAPARRLTACCPLLPPPHHHHHAQVFKVLGREGVNVQMLSQGASKTNISLIVADAQAKHAVRALHAEFFATAAKRAAA